MRFIDETTLKISAGHGGPGCVSFRREKFIPRGGPDGGDGGKGGDITFVSTTQLGTLQDLRFKRSYKAENGLHGSGKNKAGRDGASVEIKIPVGTMIKDMETDEVLFDFTDDGQRWVAAKGGRGGKGNTHFVTATFQAPKFAQPGEEGEERTLKLELKLLADASLVGYPNAGKSTLISRMSAAHPKIADYPFTTLTPNLGVVKVAEFKSFVVADIPGLIEGAHKGLGLGHKFLKHIERTKITVHLLDGTHLLDFTTVPDEEEGASAKKGAAEMFRLYKAIRKELELFNPDLADKDEVIVINKSDLFRGQPQFLNDVRAEFKALYEEGAKKSTRKLLNKEPYAISCASGDGVLDLIHTVWEKLGPESYGPEAMK
ncbi:MAG: GTPase ObgE [Bdellovibrionales bacterium]|nr:GTPase ObgE [Bdellovibrionales bacterium]